MERFSGEGRVRSLRTETVGDVELGSEFVQSVDVAEGEEVACVLRPPAFVWVKSLTVLVVQHLQCLYDTHQLTWHERSTGESLPKNEIWLKVGGDKGGGSFKFGIQIVNRHAQNAAEHTAVVACPEANDSLWNSTRRKISC